MKENVLVLFGGKSVEHDISIITALQIMKSMGDNYNIIPLYIERSGQWCTADNLDEIDTFIDFNKNVKKRKEVTLKLGEPYLYVKGMGAFRQYKKIDVALLCLHGGSGEDGSVASLLSMCNMPYTSSSHTSSAICMDKIFTKQVLSSLGIANIPFCYFTKKQFKANPKDVLKRIKKLGYPVIIKPANLGSSVAIDIARKEKDVEDKINVALEFDERILVEKFLEGATEVNCACARIDGELLTSKVVKVSKGKIFSFEEKYIKNDVQNTKKIDKNIEKEIKKLTKEVYEALSCDGVVRVDYLMAEDKIYVNEINSIPGSLSIHMFEGISKGEFIDKLLENAKASFEEKKHLTFVFESEALQIFKREVEFAKSRK